MKCAFNAQPFRSRPPCPVDAKPDERAAKLGRVAAGILVLFLAISAVMSIVVNVRYGWVARQHVQVAVAPHAADLLPPAPHAL